LHRYQLKQDKWLSNILSQSCFNLIIDNNGEGLSEQLKKYEKITKIISIKITGENISVINELQEHNFKYIQTMFNFSGKISKSTQYKNIIRFAIPDDKEQVIDIAYKSFKYSRFHMDPLVSCGHANEIKSLWAGNYFAGTRGNKMIVAIKNNQVIGFLQLIEKDDKGIVIDLIAVKSELSGQGIAKEMISYMSDYYESSSMNNHITVGTQAVNKASVCLYLSLGLKFFGETSIFHLHDKILN
jgi:predicted GNAT family acetyltransferase